jgi:hypothetical protein
MGYGWKNIRAIALCAAVLLAFLGTSQAAGSHILSLKETAPGTSSLATGEKIGFDVKPGESVDMHVVLAGITAPPIAGWNLYLRYDPKVIASVSLENSLYKTSKSEQIEPGLFYFEGSETLGKANGDVDLATLRLNVDPKAPRGTTALKLMGPKRDDTKGTSAVWGPFFSKISGISFQDTSLTVTGDYASPEASVVTPEAASNEISADKLDVQFSAQGSATETEANVSSADRIKEIRERISLTKANDDASQTAIAKYKAAHDQTTIPQAAPKVEAPSIEQSCLEREALVHESVANNSPALVTEETPSFGAFVNSTASNLEFAKDTNKGSIRIGDDMADAYGSLFNDGKGPMARNNLEILKNQNTSIDQCCSTAIPGLCHEYIPQQNIDKIRAGNRGATSMGSADSANNVKIVSRQE